MSPTVISADSAGLAYDLSVTDSCWNVTDFG